MISRPIMKIDAIVKKERLTIDYERRKIYRGSW